MAEPNMEGVNSPGPPVHALAEKQDLSMSAYEQAGYDHDWLSELSDEWISNGGSAEPSEQGSGRGTSIRTAFGPSGRIDTILEEPETSTVRIVLSETDAQNTPEWKRRLDEAKTTKDLFSPCHLENLFKDDTATYYHYFLSLIIDQAEIPLNSHRLI
jgi:hypothetical protein